MELAVRVGREGLAELAVQVAQVVRAALVVPENPVAWGVLESPAVLVVPGDLVVPESPEELQLVPAVEELELAPEAEPELVQAAVEPELVQAAVPRGTKSVTAVRHHGLVPVPAAEVLGAVAETTRAPAAPEAGAAWAVAE